MARPVRLRNSVPVRSLYFALLLVPGLVSFAPTRRRVVTEHDANGQLVSRVEYRDGKRDGLSEAWYPNGQLAYRRGYAQGRESGEHTGWWPDGRLHFAYHYRDGLIEGEAREWYPNGIQYRDFHYQGGHEEGNERMWYTDGKLRANYVMRDGRRFGLPGVKGCDGVTKEVASRESRVARTGL